MNQFKLFLGAFLLIGAGASALGQQPYTLSNSAATLYKDRTSVTPLDNQSPAATPGVNGQGQLIQLGYFSTATDLALFSGVFMPLAQFKSGDSTTGSVNIPNGRISLNAEFNTSSQVTNFPGFATATTYSALSSYPLAGTPLAIRWYDSTNTSGFYNSVSATNWDWVTPTAIPAAAITFNPDPANFPVGLAFEDNANQFVASIPEPSDLLMLGFGGAAIGALLIRRRIVS